MIPTNMRVWFNKTFSSVHAAFSLIRQADRDERYTLVCSNTNPHSLSMRTAHEAVVEPADLSGEAYVEWCLDFCQTQRIDIFVPGKETSRIARHEQRFLKNGARLLYAAPPDVLDVLNDKALFYQQANSLHAPAAPFHVVTTLAEFDSAYGALGSQYSSLCIKPAVSVYGIGFRRIVENRSALDIFLGGNFYQSDLDSLRRVLGGQEYFAPLILMPYLAGPEFSVDCVADRGRIVCAVPRHKLQGTGEGQIIDPREDVLAACTELGQQFSLNGFVNIQFRDSKEGLRVLEINPRMSGGIAMACLGGPNLPYLGIAGFDRGFEYMDIPEIHANLRVGEMNTALVLT